MLLLITGASGVGKSTTRLAIASELVDEVEAIELWHLGPIPSVPTVAWRQQMTELAVQRAIALEAEGRHLLFAGDPVAAGEALAARSSDSIDIAVCLLDANQEAQTARLRAAGHSGDLLSNNVGFGIVDASARDRPVVRARRDSQRQLARDAVGAVDGTVSRRPTLGDDRDGHLGARCGRGCGARAAVVPGCSRRGCTRVSGWVV